MNDQMNTDATVPATTDPADKYSMQNIIFDKMSKNLKKIAAKPATLSLAVMTMLLLTACNSTGSNNGGGATPTKPTLVPVSTKPTSDVDVSLSTKTLDGEVLDIKHTITHKDSKTPRPISYNVSDAAYGESWEARTQLQADRSLLGTNIGLGVDKARAQGLDGSGVTVAVLDTGINNSTDVESSRIQKVGDRPRQGDIHGAEIARIMSGTKNGVASRANVVDATHNLTQPSVSSAMIEASKIASIINYSGGSTDISALDDKTLSFAKNNALYPATKAIKENGALLVQTTGNQGWGQPQSDALIAYLDPELTKGLIFVTATNTAKDRTMGSQDGKIWANKCGLAKDYCMAAPGWQAVKEGDTVYSSNGTSIAAPRVAGAAALVKQKYPWASNDVLRTILLTTADDLGDKESFGWGMLNVKTAINGPKQLPFGALNVNVQPGERGSVFSFSNDISGTGSLIKTGSATLNLDGANTFSGGLFVKEGDVNVNKTYSGVATATQKGTISGEGIVATAVAKQGGTVDFGEGLVVGNLISEKDGNVAVRLGDSGKQGRVAGDAKLAGNLNVVVYSKDQNTVADQHKDALLINKREGTFDTVKAPALFTPAVNYTDKGLDITLTKKDGSAVVATYMNRMSDTASRAVKSGGDNAYAASSNQEKATDTVKALYSNNNVDQVISSLYSMSDSVHGNSRNIAVIQAGDVSRQVQNNVAHLVKNNALNENNGFSFLANYTDGSTDWTPSSDTKGKSDLQAVSVGIAYKEGDMAFGVVASQHDSNWTESFNGVNMGKADTKTKGIQVHWAHQQPDNITVAVSAAGYDMNSDNERKNNLINDTTTSKANVDTRLYQAGVNFTKGFDVGSTKVAVQGGYRADLIKMDGYEEKNDIGYTLKDGKRNEVISVWTLDTTATKTFNTVIPVDASIGVGVEYDGSDRLISNGSWELDRARYKANGQLGMNVTNNIRATLDANYAKSGDYENLAGIVGLQFKF